MQLTSINLGSPRQMMVGDRVKDTGIFKIPAGREVEVTALGLAGDSICDTSNHGGPDQAVYVYGQADYDWWSLELQHELRPGAFGENLTIGGLESSTFLIGDRLNIGPVILEVTSPRIPCRTLAARMEDPNFIARFRLAERPGLYCRVIRTGTLHAGDEVNLKKYPGGSGVSILEAFRAHYDKNKSAVQIQRLLDAPIDIREREHLERLLTSIRGG